MINLNILDVSLEIISKSVYFHTQRVDVIPEMLDSFIDEHIQYIGEHVDSFYEAKEVYWIYASLTKEDFHKQVSESYGNKHIKNNPVINIKYLDESRTKIVFVYYEIDSLSNIKHKRKTLQELKLNLEEAVQKENYELAEKIKNKITLKEKTNKSRFK